MYCIHCGRVIADDSRFCTFCGSPVTPADKTAHSGQGQPGQNGSSRGSHGPYTKTWTGTNVRTQEQIKQTAQQYQPRKEPKPQTQVVPARPAEAAVSAKVQRAGTLQTRVLGVPMSENAATGVYLFALIVSLLAAIFGA